MDYVEGQNDDVDHEHNEYEFVMNDKKKVERVVSHDRYRR